jgi:hypothetical protein
LDACVIFAVAEDRHLENPPILIASELEFLREDRVRNRDVRRVIAVGHDDSVVVTFSEETLKVSADRLHRQRVDCLAIARVPGRLDPDASEDSRVVVLEEGDELVEEVDRYPLRGPTERALRWDGSCLYQQGGRYIPPEGVRDLRLRAPSPEWTIAVGGQQRRPDWDEEREHLRAVAGRRRDVVGRVAAAGRRGGAARKAPGVGRCAPNDYRFVTRQR